MIFKIKKGRGRERGRGNEWLIFGKQKTKSLIVGELGLLAPDQYHYLKQSGCYTVDGVDDKREFEDVVKAMNVIGLSAQERIHLLFILPFSLLSASPYALSSLLCSDLENKI